MNVFVGNPESKLPLEEENVDVSRRLILKFIDYI
jgi:hypothetical protein